MWMRHYFFFISLKNTYISPQKICKSQGVEWNIHSIKRMNPPTIKIVHNYKNFEILLRIMSQTYERWNVRPHCGASKLTHCIKNSPAMQETQEMTVWSWVRKIPWRRAWQPTPLFLPGEFHGQRSLASYSSWGWKQLDMTKELTG